MAKAISGVEGVLARMKKIYEVEKDAGLARAMNISPQTLSSWKQRSAVPYGLCVECAKTMGASLDWLLYGEGEMMRGQNSVVSVQSREGIEGVSQKAEGEGVRTKILSILEGLSQEDLEDILSEAAHRKRLRALEERFENIQSQFFETERRAI